jgi:hypothetical protein
MHVQHLRELASPMSEEELTAGAHPAEWTVVQVPSHLGSGAVIMRRRLMRPSPVRTPRRTSRPRVEPDDDRTLLARCTRFGTSREVGSRSAIHVAPVAAV